MARREAQAFADLQQGFKPLAEQAVAALYRLHEQRVGEEVPAAIKEDPLARKSLVNDANSCAMSSPGRPESTSTRA